MTALDPRQDFAAGYYAQGDMVASACGSIVWMMSPETALELRKTHLHTARTYRDQFRSDRRHLSRHMWRASLTYAAELGRALRRINRVVH